LITQLPKRIVYRSAPAAQPYQQLASPSARRCRLFDDPATAILRSIQSSEGVVMPPLMPSAKPLKVLSAKRRRAEKISQSALREKRGDSENRKQSQNQNESPRGRHARPSINESKSNARANVRS
jgi:hypothetical protein